MGVNPFASNCADQAVLRTEEFQSNGAIGEIFGRCCLDPAQEAFYSPTIQETRLDITHLDQSETQTS